MNRKVAFVGLCLAISGCVVEEDELFQEKVRIEDPIGALPDSSSELSIEGREQGYTLGDFVALEDGGLPPSAIAGTVCPGNVKLYGIDVSYYQGTIDWNQVKASGKRFAVVRVSDGTTFMDPQFQTNWRNAKAAGVIVGAYQFFRPNQDAVAQADIMVDALQEMGFNTMDLPPVIDVETTGGMSNSYILSQMNVWLARVQSLTGRLPTLYTSPGFWSGIGNPTPSPFPNLWVAHWTSNCPTLPPNWSTL